MNIEGSISELMARVAKTHRGLAQSLLGEVGLHPGQEFVLAALWARDGQSQAELAQALAVAAPTVSKMVARMEAAGLVQTRASEADARATLVELAPKGRRLRKQVEAQWERLEAASVGHLAPREREALRESLQAVLEGLNRAAR